MSRRRKLLMRAVRRHGRQKQYNAYLKMLDKDGNVISTKRFLLTPDWLKGIATRHHPVPVSIDQDGRVTVVHSRIVESWPTTGKVRVTAVAADVYRAPFTFVPDAGKETT